MTTCMDTLPIELIEYIVTFLDVRDIASFRLTSRNLESKASQGHFKGFFTEKEIIVTAERLQNMVHVMATGRLGCLLQHCIISGVAEPQISSTFDIAECQGLLTKAFNFLKQRSATGGLVSLSFCVIVLTRPVGDGTFEVGSLPSWTEIWAAALHTFEITMAALSESKLLVYDHLDLYGYVSSCSLNYHAFLHLTRNISSMGVFHHLKTLILSLSSPHDASEQTLAQETAIYGHSQTWHVALTFRGILRMIESMPELEVLHLHWYSLPHDACTTLVQPTISLDCSIHPLTTTRLKECSVRGLHTSESDLLYFIKALNPAVLILADVCLISGTYASIFEHLTNPDTPMTQYFIDDIFEYGNLVHFDTPGTPKFPYRGVDMGPSLLTRHTSHLKEPIRYSFTSRRPVGNRERRRWLEHKVREFGPSEDLRPKPIPR
ncbi:hypothetical protein F5X98DRAFT_368628 [Xylaria grammica]|nr:hypothetical protein F5X98DRAFT_368628 [Xylaria grammica]